MEGFLPTLKLLPQLTRHLVCKVFKKFKEPSLQGASSPQMKQRLFKILDLEEGCPGNLGLTFNSCLTPRPTFQELPLSQTLTYIISICVVCYVFHHEKLWQIGSGTFRQPPIQHRKRTKCISIDLLSIVVTYIPLLTIFLSTYLGELRGGSKRFYKIGYQGSKLEWFVECGRGSSTTNNDSLFVLSSFYYIVIYLFWLVISYSWTFFML